MSFRMFRYYALLNYLVLCVSSASPTIDSGSCFEGWTWLSGQCYTVEDKQLSWDDAHQYCMNVNHGRLVQFDDIPQQTELQTTLTVDSKKGFWIGLKSNGTGWTWTDGHSNQYNSFSQDEFKDDINSGQCVLMNGRYWYQKECNSMNSFICETSTKECEIRNGWTITPTHHCIKIEQGNKTWHKSREYCLENNADLIVLDDITEREFVKNLSLTAELWIGLYYNDTVKSFVWVNGSVAYQIDSGSHTFSVTARQCAALGPIGLVTQSDLWALRSCDIRLGFICILQRENNQKDSITTEISSIFTTVDTEEMDNGSITTAMSTSIKVKIDTYTHTTDEKILAANSHAMSGLTQDTVLPDTITQDTVLPDTFPMDYVVSQLTQAAYKAAHEFKLQCNNNGMTHLLQELLQILANAKDVEPGSKFQIILTILDSAFESNNNGSNFQKCFQSKESSILVEPFIRTTMQKLNITSKKEFVLPNLGYILEFTSLENIHTRDYQLGNVTIQIIQPSVYQPEDEEITISIVVFNFNKSSSNTQLYEWASENKTMVIGPILSVTAYTNNSRLSLQHTFVITHGTPLQQVQKESLFNRSLVVESQCVFYDELYYNWSNYGCTKVGENEGKTMCECNHTTNFAILMQVTDFKLQDIHVLALDIITYIGCSVSLLSQLITLTVFTCVGSLNSERVFVHRNLCVAIIFAQLCFLSGIKAVQYKVVCAIVAVVLHYFYTAVFVWMLVEGLLLYSKVVQVFGTEKSRVTYYCMFGWGVPVVMVAVSASADWNGYGTETSCWLSTNTGAIWAFVGPAIAIILVNIVILWMVIRIVISSAKHEQRTEYNQIRAGVKGALILIPLLGLTWLFGLIAVNEELVIFQYLFAICNSLQGFFIFLFHCVLNTEVRQALKRLKDRQQLLRGDFTSLTSGSYGTNFPKKSLSKKEFLGADNTNSNGTTSTRVGSRNSINSRVSDDIVVQDITGEEVGLSYI